MFEIVITVHLIVRNVDAIFVSNTKYDTMAICEATIPRGLAELQGHVLDHMIEKFTIDKMCRAVTEGA